MTDATTQTTPEDDFSSAFATLTTKPDDPPEQPAAEAPVETPSEPEAQPETPPAPTPSAETPEPPPPAPAPKPPVTSVPVEEPDTDAEADAILQRLAALVRNPQAQQQAPQAQSQQQAPEPDIYSPEEVEFLTSYEKDWPDVARAEALRRRKEYRDLVGFVFKEISAHLAPMQEQVAVLATRTHLGDITSAVPDYNDLRDKVIDWVGQQPSYLRNAYEHVINRGTAEEIADLIGRYRASTAPAAPAAAAPPARKEPELPPAAKQAAAALAPVGSKSSAGATQAFDPNDFDGAFAKFAKAAGM